MPLIGNDVSSVLYYMLQSSMAGGFQSNRSGAAPQSLLGGGGANDLFSLVMQNLLGSGSQPFSFGDEESAPVRYPALGQTATATEITAPTAPAEGDTRVAHPDTAALAGEADTLIDKYDGNLQTVLRKILD